MMMRSLMAAALVVAAATGAAAQERLKVVTTFTVIADMARNVAGDVADVESITRPGAEIHEYQPTPRDIVRAQGAGLVLRNGFGLEQWFDRFLANLGDVQEVVISEGVEPLPITEGPYRGRANPHAWMSSDDAQMYVDNIARAMAERDPANAATYRDNAEAYKARIRAVAEPVRNLLAQIPEQRRWLVTSEGAFSYMARDLGLRELYIWPINADSQGTPGQIRRVIDTMREYAIPVIFSENTVSPDPARQVARETGARYGGVLYVDSLSEEGGPVPSYLDLLRVTAETIAEGLSE